jgi:hypothetical protein
MPEVTEMAIIAGVLGIAGAVAIRFKSFKSTIDSIHAMRKHNIRTVVLEVGDKTYRVSLEGTDADVSSLKAAQSAIAEERLKRRAAA